MARGIPHPSGSEGPARLRALGLVAKGRLTVAQLTRVRWVFGGHPGPLGDYFVGWTGRSDEASSAMLDALAVEEELLGRTLKIVRRVPDPVPWFTVGQIPRRH